MLAANFSAFPKLAASEAFIIPLDGTLSDASKILKITPDTINEPIEMNESLKKPPKRIQQLMEQASSSAETECAITKADLEQKQQKAEERRKQLMQQKIETIQKTTQMLSASLSKRNLKAPEDGEEAPAQSSLNLQDINAKALDDDSKQELISTTQMPLKSS